MNLKLLACCSLFTFSCFSQTSYDAMNFGMTDLVGGARFVSMGGAFTALGSDLSSFNLNPAGAGVKKTNAFAGTIALNTTRNESTFLSKAFKSTKNVLSLPSFVYVGVNNAYKSPTYTSDWDRFNFSFGLQRTNNLNRMLSFSGHHNGKSYINTLKDNAQAQYDNGEELTQDQWEYLAYQTLLLNQNLKGNYYSVLANDGQTTDYNYQSSGSGQEVMLTLSTSYKEKLYLGVGFGFPILVQSTDEKLIESNFEFPDAITIGDPSNEPTNSIEAQFSHIKNLIGTGVKSTVGAIYKITPALRLGASYHTPCVLNIEEFTSAQVNSFFDNNQSFFIDYSGYSYFDLKIPSKSNIGLAYVFKKKGLLSIDYQYTNLRGLKYQVPHLDINEDYFEFVNADIKASLGESHVVKFGGEYNLKPFRLRAGLALQNSPYQHYDDFSSRTYSGGLGYSNKEFYIDFAYTYMQRNETLSIYRSDSGVDVPTSLAIQDKFRETQILLTIGYKLIHLPR
ncbi:MAG: outer membrane protein transport protein [Flavobacteriales bacterium]